MAKQILILGAGLVSQPIIDYVLKNTSHSLCLADIQVSNAENALGGHPRGQAAELDVNNDGQLGELVSNADLVVSLLPYAFHVQVARHCLDHKVPMLNASYVSEEMRELQAEAQEKGVLILCELGLDPGIDHMSAMKIIHEATERGGKIQEFVSVCGGLPAPEANNNPFGYKFSWSPRGVLAAGKSDAKYISDSNVEEIDAQYLFKQTRRMHIADMDFEYYPNRDSVSYKETYELENVRHLLRGTLRYPEWHRYITAFKTLHLLDETPLPAGDYSFAQLVSDINNFDLDNLYHEAALALEVSDDSKIMQALTWLGIFDETKQQFPESSALDQLAGLMASKMSYRDGERDMVVLHHQFQVEYDEHMEAIGSTLIEYGEPDGYSAMAKTVSLPLAAAAELVLDGSIARSGVIIPVYRDIYEPVLDKLEQLGIQFRESITEHSKETIETIS